MVKVKPQPYSAGSSVTSLSPDLLLAPLTFWASLQAGPSSQHVHHVRRALEVESAGRAAQALDGDTLRQLADLLDEAARLVGTHDHEGAMALDLRFHHLIAQAAGNPILLALIDALAQPTVRGRVWQSIHEAGRLPAAHAEHRAILEALRSGDVLAARATMDFHLIQSTAHLPHGDGDAAATPPPVD